MYKLIFGARRKPGMSREDFGCYWTTVHVERASSSRLSWSARTYGRPLVVGEQWHERLGREAPWV